MTFDLNAAAVIGATMTAIGALLLLIAARKGMKMSTHAQDPEMVKDGEVNVDVTNHEVVRHESDGSRSSIGRTRTTPTVHDGKQRQR
jgi:hypothetical protein